MNKKSDSSSSESNSSQGGIKSNSNSGSSSNSDSDEKFQNASPQLRMLKKRHRRHDRKYRKKGIYILINNHKFFLSKPWEQKRHHRRHHRHCRFVCHLFLCLLTLLIIVSIARCMKRKKMKRRLRRAMNKFMHLENQDNTKIYLNFVNLRIVDVDIRTGESQI